MKNKKFLIGILGCLLVLTLTLFSGFTFAHADELPFDEETILKQCEEMTASDDLSINDLTVDEYIENIKNNSYSRDRDGVKEQSRHLKAIIPESVFYCPGEYYYIGKEYMFYNRNDTASLTGSVEGIFRNGRGQNGS